MQLAKFNGAQLACRSGLSSDAKSTGWEESNCDSVRGEEGAALAVLMTERDGWGAFKLVARQLAAALPQPSAPPRENQLHLPLAPLQDPGTWFRDAIPQQTAAWRVGCLRAQAFPLFSVVLIRTSAAAARGSHCPVQGRGQPTSSCQARCAGLEVGRGGPICCVDRHACTARQPSPTKRPIAPPGHSSLRRTHCIVRQIDDLNASANARCLTWAAPVPSLLLIVVVDANVLATSYFYTMPPLCPHQRHWPGAFASRSSHVTARDCSVLVFCV